MGVRREKVILELEDRLTSEMARAAAQTALLRQEVERLERQRARDGQMTDRNLASYRRLTDELRRQQSAMAGVSNGLNNFNRQVPSAVRNTRQLSNEINTASGRLGLLASAAITLGPALIPATAAAIPAVTGLANQLGIAALAAGTAVVAFQGVGDALKAVNEYDLEPTAANLEKVGETFGRLDRDTQVFTLRISAMRGQIAGLRDAAASGLFPPLTRELGEVDTLLERVESLLFTTGRAAGMELAAGLESMNGDRWQEFFGFLDREAVPTMHDLAQIIGNSAHAFAEMWMAFQPLNRDFGDWLVDVTADWDRWAQGLAESESFTDFVDYIQDNGPRVAETVGALAGALADVVVAAAPLGGPALEALEAIADVVSAIASSDVGTPLLAGVAAMTLLSRTTRAFNAVAGTTMVGNIRNISSDYRAAAASGGIWSRQMGPLTQQMAGQRAQAERLQRTIKGFAAGGAAIAGLGIAASGAADGLGLTNTVSLGLMGTLAGPWGAAVGAGVGLLMDFTAATDAAAEAQATASDWVDAFRATLDRQSGAVTAATREQVAMAVANDEVRAAADALGMSMDDVVDLVYAGEDALSAFADQALVSRDATQGEIDAASGYGTLLNAILPYRAALEEARGQQAAFIEGVGEGGAAFDESAAAIERMTTAYQRWTDTLSAFDAATAMAGALTALDKVVAETGVSFDASTEKGQAFREALSGWSQATQDLLDNTPMAERGAAIEQQIRNLSSELGISIDTAWDWANAVGISAETVNAAMAQAEAQTGVLGDRLRSLPPEIQTEIVTNGIPQTEAQVADLVAGYDDAEGIRATILQLQTLSAEQGLENWGQMVNQLDPVIRQQLVLEDLRGRAVGGPVDSYFADWIPDNLVVPVDTSQIDAAQQRTNALDTSLDQMTDPRQVGVGLVGSDGMQADLGNIRERLNGISGPNWTATLSAQDRLSGVVANARAALASIDRSITVRITGVMSGFSNLASRSFSAGGNFFPAMHPAVAAYAAGGMDAPNRHEAEITSPGGPVRIWSEPETKGEAYIPLADDWRRPRAIDIWAQTGRELGVLHFARGGVSAAQQRKNDVRAAISGFAPEYRRDLRDPRMAALGDELNELRWSLRAAGVAFTREATNAAAAMQKTASRLFTLQDSVDALRESQKSLISGATGNFRKDLWGNGVAGARLQLEADINDARTARNAQAILGKKGVSVGLLEGLYASGDIAGMTQLAGMSKAEIAELNKLYATRQSVSSAVGGNAAQQVYGAQIAKLDKQIAAQTAALAKYEKAIESAAYRGYVAGAKAVAAGTNSRRKG